MPDDSDANLFTMSIEESDVEPRELGKYRAINDAILAVAQQETGFLPWDALCFEEVPYRVHDITCWDFENYFGTNASDRRSEMNE